MAEPLSLTSSILTLLTTSFAVAKGLYDIAEGIVSAGREVRIYADEIDTLGKILQNLHLELENGEARRLLSDGENLLKDILHLCNQLLHPLDQLQQVLRPLLERFKNSGRKLNQFGLRVRWLFSSKPKLLFFRDSINGMRRNLDTLLALVIFQRVNGSKEASVHVIQISLQNSVSSVRLSLNDYRTLGLPAASREVGPLLEFNEEASSIGFRDTQNFFIKPDHGLRGGFVNDASTPKPEASDSHALTHLTQSPLSNNDDINDEETNKIGKEIDRELDDLSEIQEISEDNRSLSRRVLRFVENSLKTPSNQNAPPTTSPAREDSSNEQDNPNFFQISRNNTARRAPGSSPGLISVQSVEKFLIKQWSRSGLDPQDILDGAPGNDLWKEREKALENPRTGRRGSS
ncbi:hypothetical protein CC78DRAFT_546649 [Lojkania enalia]|uniref:Fungal N-terminal domain-containing protein n=1 Tax=Lojkania enalia TaxID=147567 RepID=A0A9P4K3Y6_9PLEO|nr:hypothetical protein CC78DRAFT_546649 [Didymosphaeria enalia]